MPHDELEGPRLRRAGRGAQRKPKPGEAGGPPLTPAWVGTDAPRSLEDLIDYSAGMLDAMRQRHIQPDEGRAIGAMIKAHRELLELAAARDVAAPPPAEHERSPIPDELLSRVQRILDATETGR